MGVDRHRSDAPGGELDRMSRVGEVPGAHLEVRAGLARRHLRHREQDAVVVGEDRCPSLVRSEQAREERSRRLRHVGEAGCGERRGGQQPERAGAGKGQRDDARWRGAGSGWPGGRRVGVGHRISPRKGLRKSDTEAGTTAAPPGVN